MVRPARPAEKAEAYRVMRPAVAKRGASPRPDPSRGASRTRWAAGRAAAAHLEAATRGCGRAGFAGAPPAPARSNRCALGTVRLCSAQEDKVRNRGRTLPRDGLSATSPPSVGAKGSSRSHGTGTEGHRCKRRRPPLSTTPASTRAGRRRPAGPAPGRSPSRPFARHPLRTGTVLATVGAARWSAAPRPRRPRPRATSQIWRIILACAPTPQSSPRGARSRLRWRQPLSPRGSRAKRPEREGSGSCRLPARVRSVRA